MSEAFDSELVLPSGAVITCPNPHCRDKIAVLKKDLKPGNRLTSDMFDNSGQGLRIDKKMQCKSCNHHWFISLSDMARIHTARGWFPPENQLDAATRKVI